MSTDGMGFDTLKAAHDLEGAGFSRKQAEAIASAVRRLGSGDLATKAFVFQAVLAGVAANAAIVFGLLKAMLP